MIAMKSESLILSLDLTPWDTFCQLWEKTGPIKELLDYITESASELLTTSYHIYQILT